MNFLITELKILKVLKWDLVVSYFKVGDNDFREADLEEVENVDSATHL